LGEQLEVTVEITATSDAGFSLPVTENSRTLKFDQLAIRSRGEAEDLPTTVGGIADRQRSTANTPSGAYEPINKRRLIPAHHGNQPRNLKTRSRLDRNCNPTWANLVRKYGQRAPLVWPGDDAEGVARLDRQKFS
jgi:hypothetical protein